MKMKHYLMVSILILSLMISGCSLIKEKDTKDPAASPGTNNNPIVSLEIKDRGTIKIELYPDIASNTVNSFINLVNDGFYDGVIFHRVIPDFMIQGGDPEGTGKGGPGYSIKGEFTNNNFDNPLKHTRGVISMARSPYSNDSAGSQFFIIVADSPHLDNDYASFGKVIEGMEIADEIVSVNRNKDDKPDKDEIISKATVETFGVDYPEPKKIQ